MRIYIPATLGALEQLRDEGQLPAGLTAHAVTAGLREWYAQSDTDELEHAAFLDAERQALRHLGADSTARRLRVVLSADVPDSAARPVGGADGDWAVVQVFEPVPLAAVACLHVDEPEAEADVTAAAQALRDLDEDNEDAQFVVERAEARDLLWFDITELGDVLTDYGA